jgi:putative endonuclease
MGLPKRIVYVLKSETDPSRHYTGLTSGLAARLDAHNAGQCAHTASGKPWIVDVIVEFSDERRALAFERYLKSGSGGAFARRHFR